METSGVRTSGAPWTAADHIRDLPEAIVMGARCFVLKTKSDGIYREAVTYNPTFHVASYARIG